MSVFTTLIYDVLTIVQQHLSRKAPFFFGFSDYEMSVTHTPMLHRKDTSAEDVYFDLFIGVVPQAHNIV